MRLILLLLVLAAPMVAADEKPVILEDGAPFAPVILEDGAPFDFFPTADPVRAFWTSLYIMRGGVTPAANWCFDICKTECGGVLMVLKAKLLSPRGCGGDFGCGCQCVGDPSVQRIEGACY